MKCSFFKYVYNLHYLLFKYVYFYEINVIYIIRSYFYFNNNNNKAFTTKISLKIY